jgi:excisionase family DNA binding protein
MFKPSHGVRLAEVFEYLASVTQVPSTQGSLEARCSGVAGGSGEDGSEQRMIDHANLAHCVSELEKQQNVYWAPTDVLPKFALKTRLRPGAVAVCVVRAYQPWHCDPDLSRPAGTPSIGADRGPNRGLAEVWQWMQKVQGQPVPSIKGETAAQSFKTGNLKGHKKNAAALLADADIVVAAWVDLWNTKAGFKSHITTGEFAQRYNVPLSTVQRWCAQGKLDAVVVGDVFRIDVSDIDLPSAD